MNTIIIPKKEFKIAIISGKEQKEIEKFYGKPTRKAAKNIKIKI